MTGFEIHHLVMAIFQVLAVGLAFLLIFIAHQRRSARRHEFSRMFLNKLSSEEFVDLLKSSAGRRSVERVLGTYKSAGEWITDAIRRAMILLFVGIGCLAVYAFENFPGHQAFLAVGCLCLGGAIGYLVAAALTRSRDRQESAAADM